MGISSSIYCYQDTGTLINKHDLHDKIALQNVERMISTYKLGKLEMGNFPFACSLDVHHYLAIHKYIFDDIYDFAGEIRSEEIYKKNEPYYNGVTPFCNVVYIYNHLKKTLELMNRELRGIRTKEELSSFLAHYYVELNLIHPFREGNGRTLREYLREYILMVNTYLPFEDVALDYTKWDQKDRDHLLKNTVLSVVLEKEKEIGFLFSKALVPIKIEKEIGKTL